MFSIKNLFLIKLLINIDYLLLYRFRNNYKDEIDTILSYKTSIKNEEKKYIIYY